MGESQEIAAGAARSAFGGASQHNRLMRLDFPLKEGPFAILRPNKLVAHEEVSRSFRFNVEVLANEAQIRLKMLMGRMVTISLAREDGSLRYFNGYITEFRFLRSDGGFAFYQMVLEPWLAFARLRNDNRSVHNKSVHEITEETLRHYRQADWHMYTTIDASKLTFANQYNEPDYNHLHRRWEAPGLHYWYEHAYSLFASIKQTFRLFVYKAGMKLIAASGKITMQAHDDDIELIANKVLSFISQSDWVDIRGKKGVRLHGPECMDEVTNRLEVFAAKPALFHRNLETLGPQNRPHPPSEREPKTPDDPKQMLFMLETHSVSGRPFANVPYSLFKARLTWAWSRSSTKQDRPTTVSSFRTAKSMPSQRSQNRVYKGAESPRTGFIQHGCAGDRWIDRQPRASLTIATTDP